LDPSIKKTGYAVFDTADPADSVVERGRLKTSRSDGVLVQRLLKQAGQVRELMERHSIEFISMESPYFGGNEAEHLFALNQFLHREWLEMGTYVIVFPPQQLKKLAVPDMSVNDVHKPQMINGVKELLGIYGQRITDDEADAVWAGWLGKQFYNWRIDKIISDSDLRADLMKAFAHKHTYTRRPKKGSTDYKGLIYRENELFFDFKKIRERQTRSS